MEIKAKFFHELTTKEFFYEEDGKVIAYLRAFSKEAGIVQMGRILTLQHGMGLGGKLLKE